MGRPAFEPNVGFNPTNVNAGNGQDLPTAYGMAATAGPATVPGTTTGNHRCKPLVAPDQRRKSAQYITTTNPCNGLFVTEMVRFDSLSH